jgi:hypothetical protein
VESWIDLTRDRFESIFSFTREGHNVPFIEGIERNLWGGISAITTQPIERITVARSIQFNIVQRDHEKLALGTRTDRIVYVRSSDGTFQPDPTLSTATRHDLETFYDDLGSDFTPDEFLNFHHAALTTLAKSDNRAGRVWLTHFLEECKSTPLSRNLNTLLSHH